MTDLLGILSLDLFQGVVQVLVEITQVLASVGGAMVDGLLAFNSALTYFSVKLFDFFITRVLATFVTVNTNQEI